MTPPPLSEDDIILAGEAALGLLDRASEAIVASRIATDPLFAAEVSAWQDRFAPMLACEATPPSAQLWQDIRVKIGKAPTLRPANSTSVRLWQGIAGGATAVAATLAFMLVNPPVPRPLEPSPTLIAALGSETGRAAMTATYDMQRGELLVTPIAMKTDRGFPELWVIDASGDAKSLGFVKADSSTRVAVGPALRARIKSGMTLAVTLEPDGTAPHAKAAGPVIVSGKIEIL
jgi:anti-sigma-K factor RskA